MNLYQRPRGPFSYRRAPSQPLSLQTAVILDPSSTMRQLGPPKRNIRGDTDLQKIVKVLAEASRRPPLCQAENEAPASKSWRGLHSAGLPEGSEGGARESHRETRTRPISKRSMVLDLNARRLWGPSQGRIVRSGS